MKLLTDIKAVFGTIPAPSPLKPFIDQGDQGGGGINTFLNMTITLIYTVAAVVFVFMLLWGAWDILVSGGEKEKVHDAKRRLTFAFIGIVLFGIAFAAIALVGEFTGFSFFNGQPTPHP